MFQTIRILSLFERFYIKIQLIAIFIRQESQADDDDFRPRTSTTTHDEYLSRWFAVAQRDKLTSDQRTG